VEIAVTGRHVQVSDKFRDHLTERLAKVEQLAPSVQRIDVVVSHEERLRESEWVEVTCRGKGLVIRAEAASDDRMAALDVAVDKLIERIRKVADKRKVRRRERAVDFAPPVAAPAPATESAPAPEPAAEEAPEAQSAADRFPDSPIEVRVKVHHSTPMTLEDALNRMELVGHDFFLFQDVETATPSVVYRRRGWSYGVLHLDLGENAPQSS